MPAQGQFQFVLRYGWVNIFVCTLVNGFHRRKNDEKSIIFRPHSQHKCYNFRSSWGFWMVSPSTSLFLRWRCTHAHLLWIIAYYMFPWLDFKTDYRSLIARQLHFQLQLQLHAVMTKSSEKNSPPAIRICTWDNIACHLHLDLVSPRFPNWFRFRCWFWCWFRLIWKWHKIATFEFTFAYMNTPFPWLFGYWTFRAFYTFKWDFSDAYQFVIVMGSYVCICLNDLLVMLILTNFFS